jgi:hypothetical protein
MLSFSLLALIPGPDLAISGFAGIAIPTSGEGKERTPLKLYGQPAPHNN